MKLFLAFTLFIGMISSSFAEEQTGEQLLAFVRSKLPDRPLELSGSLKVKTKKGFTKSRQPVKMVLRWGENPPTAQYLIGKESLKISWKKGVPSYQFTNPKIKAEDVIPKTGLSWSELSFSALWWSNAQLKGEGKKINRACYIVDVPVPNSTDVMRLWIEKKMGMLLETQTRNAQGKLLRRMKIKSIKKLDGLWIAKNLELKDYKTGNKTLLEISDLKWLDSPKEIPAT